MLVYDLWSSLLGLFIFVKSWYLNVHGTKSVVLIGLHMDLGREFRAFHPTIGSMAARS